MASKPSAIRGARIVGERYVRSKRQANPEGRMPLMDHLRELRNRVVKAPSPSSIGMIVALCFSSPTIHWIMRPFCDAVGQRQDRVQDVGDQLTVTGIFDPLSLRIKLAFYHRARRAPARSGCTSSGRSSRPACTRARRSGRTCSPAPRSRCSSAGRLLRLPGDGPRPALPARAVPGGVTEPATFDTYLGYFTGMVVGFGIVFELPLVIVMLNMAGHPHPRAVQQVAPDAHLRRLPAGRHRSTRAPTR